MVHIEIRTETRTQGGHILEATFFVQFGHDSVKGLWLLDELSYPLDDGGRLDRREFAVKLATIERCVRLQRELVSRPQLIPDRVAIILT